MESEITLRGGNILKIGRFDNRFVLTIETSEGAITAQIALWPEEAVKARDALTERLRSDARTIGDQP